MKYIKGIVTSAVTVSVIAFIGYRVFADPELRWQEEVKLRDGRVILMERWSKRLASGELGQRGFTLWWEIKAVNPDTSESVTWYEDAGTGPDIFDFVDKVPYMAARVDILPACRKYGWPKMNWVFFRYEGSWQQISFEQFPKHLDSNLFNGAWHAETIGRLDRLMTLPKKTAYEAEHVYPPYSMRQEYEKTKNLPPACARFGESQQPYKTK